MAAKKVDTTKTEERIHSVEEAFSKTEAFIEKNQKIIMIVIGILVVVVLGFFGFRKYYIEPKEKKAQSEMFMAEMYFEQDSLAKALNGDGQYMGFLDVMNEYSLTKSANLSKYYAGICYLKLGDFENAIKYLKKFSGKDEVVGPMATGALGDAYMELDQVDKALSYYIDAADESKNELTSPLFLMKAGQSYEILGKYDKAVLLYKRIKQDYPRAYEATEIDKYISFAEGMTKK